MSAPRTVDVLVLGEVLVELSTREALRQNATLRLAFSGDALNAAAAAAAAGARTALLARFADDELGDALVERVAALGVDTSLLQRVPGQHGVYIVRADPTGAREFVYVRRGSAGSTLGPDDVAGARIEEAGVVLASGVACALSASAAAAVEAAARRARCFVYDPNFRPRLTTREAAADALARVAPYAALVTPAWPAETGPLLGIDDAAGAAARCRELGADAVAVTCGADGVLLDDGTRTVHLPALPPPALVDQTGAGDSLVGTAAARIALGDDLPDALRLGIAAASLCLQGQGGTGHVAPLAEIRAHLERHATASRPRPDPSAGGPP